MFDFDNEFKTPKSVKRDVCCYQQQHWQQPSNNGFAVLLLPLIFSLIAFGLVMIPNTSRETSQQQLLIAKAHLLDYARTYALLKSSSGKDRTGFPPYLPCPDWASSSSHKDGNQQTNCGSINKVAVGRFPWKSLGVARLFSQSGECLWYVVSGNAKRASPIQGKSHLNQDADGWIEVANQRILAAIIMPTRQATINAKTTDYFCRGEYDLSKFLPFSVPTKENQVLTIPESQNLQIATLSADELLTPYVQSNTYQQQITTIGSLISRCYANRIIITTSTAIINLPHAAKLSLNDDRQVNDYTSQTNLYNGRLAYKQSQVFDTVTSSQITTNLLTDCFANPAINLTYPTTTSASLNEKKANPLYRIWLHSKNQWFISTFANCSQSQPQHCGQLNSQPVLSIIIYANSKQPHQQRHSKRFGSTDRNQITNYLESNTLALFQQTSLQINPNDTQHNDKRTCLLLDLSVQIC